MTSIERSVSHQFGALPRAPAPVPLRRSAQSSLVETLRLVVGPYRRRSVLCLGMMAAQAFFYNSVFFSLPLVLLRYYGLTAARVGLCFLPIAMANCLGPMMLGRLFDTFGRRQMIAITYSASGVLLFAGSWLFYREELGLYAQVGWWCAIFFFASTAASSAYLTVSEVFPQNIRASAIALFYAVGTIAGGVFGPVVFGRLSGSGARHPLFLGYCVGALVMAAAGLAQARWGVAAERKSLEELTLGPTASDAPREGYLRPKAS